MEMKDDNGFQSIGILKDAMTRLKHGVTYFANPNAAFVANFLA